MGESPNASRSWAEDMGDSLSEKLPVFCLGRVAVLLGLNDPYGDSMMVLALNGVGTRAPTRLGTISAMPSAVGGSGFHRGRSDAYARLTFFGGQERLGESSPNDRRGTTSTLRTLDHPAHEFFGCASNLTTVE